MTNTEAAQLLDQFRAGKTSRESVLRAFQATPFIDLDFAKVDTHRSLRKGFPEVIFASGKTAAQVVKITAALLTREQRVLVTRTSTEQARALKRKFRRAIWHETARCVTIEENTFAKA